MVLVSSIVVYVPVLVGVEPSGRGCRRGSWVWFLVSPCSVGELVVDHRYGVKMCNASVIP